MNVRSTKDAVCAVIVITLLAMLASVLIAGTIAAMLGRELQLVFALGVPVIGVPFFAIPLVRANLRLYQARAELEHLVRTDSLTGLANRRSFLEQATNLFSSPDACADDVAVMMVDIDHFKRINDSCGHDIGDKVLGSVANAIVAVTLQERRGQVLVGRIGGEEFAVLARGLDSDGAVELAERLCVAVRRLRWSKCAQAVTPTVSVGVAIRHAGETFAEVLKAADIAVYDAKALGRDRWCFAHRDIAVPAVAGMAKGEHRAATERLRHRDTVGPPEAGAAALRNALLA